MTSTFKVVVTLLASAAAHGCRSIPPKATPGSSVRVADVHLENFDVLPPDAVEDLHGRIPLKSGGTLTDTAEQTTGNLAVETLQNHGYPYAAVQIERMVAGPDGTRLVVRADPGPLGFFGQTDIAGNTRVEDSIIRRRIAYEPGDLFNRSAMERSQQQIGALELFKSVRIEATNLDQRPVDVPTLITVEEQNPWRWNLSLGYEAAERLSFEARLRNVNFFGGARHLEITGRVSSIDRLAEVMFIQPELIRPRVSLSLQARHWSVDGPAFQALSRGGQAAVTWTSTPRLSTTFAYAASRERGNVTRGLDPLTELQDGMLSAWSLDLDHRTPGVERAAPSGRAMLMHLEQAGGWMPGTFNYYNVFGEARLYRTPSNRRFTFAAQGRYGSIAPMGADTDIPILKRLFLGGSGQMRGWSRFEVSPLSIDGEPIGGKSMLAGTAEIRVPLMHRLRAALFAEGGNVWRRDWTVHFDDLLFDAGPGVRIDTPFGVIRVDVGFQLNSLEGLRIDGQPQRHPWRINLGLGEAF
ncbi:MAG: BamA/TamA family outer membrane protein [Vicinamibacterales bacterium]|nr:BamA/TamA family outer membrane protein [Vicinamibacterales bacterium]